LVASDVVVRGMPMGKTLSSMSIVIGSTITGVAAIAEYDGGVEKLTLLLLYSKFDTETELGTYSSSSTSIFCTLAPVTFLILAKISPILGGKDIFSKIPLLLGKLSSLEAKTLDPPGEYGSLC
jgi:hypothetical protein